MENFLFFLEIRSVEMWREVNDLEYRPLYAMNQRYAFGRLEFLDSKLFSLLLEQFMSENLIFKNVEIVLSLWTYDGEFFKQTFIDSW